MFSTQDREKIRAAVTAVEKTTSGEIVTVAVPASGFYAWVHWLWTVLGFVVATLGILFWNFRGAWPLDLNEALCLQFLAGALGFALPSFAFLKRVSIPRRLRDHEVHEAAQAHFVSAGVHQTREHTGILIYISFFERQVEILADEGIHKIVGADFWRDQVEQIVAGIRAGAPADGLLKAIAAMGEKLATHFPSRPDDTNELSDELRG